jgi:hypothetical protein
MVLIAKVRLRYFQETLVLKFVEMVDDLDQMISGTTSMPTSVMMEIKDLVMDAVKSA